MNWDIIVSDVRISLRRVEVSCIISTIPWLKLLLFFLVLYTYMSLSFILFLILKCEH